MVIYIIMSAVDHEMQLFWTWFQILNSGQRRAFLDRLVSVAVPNKLFARVEQTLTGSHRLPDTWEHCRSFEEQAAFCRARVQGWSAAQANAFVNALEGIDQAAVYEFYDKIASTVGEP